MISIDKLTLAFKLQEYDGSTLINQFERIERKIEEQTKENEYHDFDFSDYSTLRAPYIEFNRTKLVEVDLKEVVTHFRFNYWVFVDQKKIALLQWCSNGTTKHFGYMSLINESLYDGDWKLFKQAISDLGLVINNISRLDIAFDSPTNPTDKYLRIAKNPNNEIVINGNIVKDRNQLLKSPYFITYGTLNEPLKYPQIHFKTTDGSTKCRTYNKSEEIKEHSHKTYIEELLRRVIKRDETNIYRCEVSLNSKVLYRIIEEIGKSENLSGNKSLEVFLSRLEDTTYLTHLHQSTMMRLFRWSKKGKTKRKSILTY